MVSLYKYADCAYEKYWLKTETGLQIDKAGNDDEPKGLWMSIV